MMTVGEMRRLAPAGLVTNDRGNGCGGPGYINEFGAGPLACDEEQVSPVTYDEDPDAWELAAEALRSMCDQGVPLTCVAVGERASNGEFSDPSGHQTIYAY